MTVAVLHVGSVGSEMSVESDLISVRPWNPKPTRKASSSLSTLKCEGILLIRYVVHALYEVSGGSSEWFGLLLFT